MKAFIIIFLTLLLCQNSISNEEPAPEYLKDFYQNILLPMLPKHKRPAHENPYRLKLLKEGDTHVISLEVLIPDPRKARKEWNVFSKYQFVFLEDEDQRREPARIKVHRLMNGGEYLGAAIEGQLIVNFNGNHLSEKTLLPGLVRSVFRSDYTLHQMFKNPLLPENKQVKTLTPPQIRALGGDPENEIPGLITMYKDFKDQGQVYPMHAALMLPTGNGKSIVAIKYLEMVKMLYQGTMPKVLFLVENKIILADMVQKLQEQFPGVKIATLFGQNTNMAIAPETQFILATRSTGFRRQDEILDFLASKSEPKVIFRDESQHTGKAGGQFSQMLVNIMNRFGGETQVIDMSATPWHEDAPDLIRQYQGRVATTFVTADEYQKLIMGQQVDRIARLQLVRAILDGWLAPLDNLTFVTQSSENNKDDVSFRARLLREQYEMLDRLGLDFNDETIVKLNELSDSEVSFLKDEIKKVHEPIVEELLKDLRAQILRDRNGKVAEYDRGIIFVPSILHAEAYQFLLSEATGGNMEFRVVHSKQSRTNTLDVVEENIDWFNGTRDPYKHRYLISVDMLREGVDIPSVNRIVSVTTSESIKILLQMFGRATRLNPLKSGIRLTDFGGSFLRFFQEIPGSLLKTLFPLYENQFVDNSSFMSFGDKEKKRTGVVVDGESIDVSDLQFVQLNSPMQELAYVGDRDEARIRRASLEVLEDHLSIFEQHEELYSWSLEVDEEDPSDVAGWINEWLNWDLYNRSEKEQSSSTYTSAYSESRSFNKGNHLSSLDEDFRLENRNYKPLTESDIESLVQFISTLELLELSSEKKENYQPSYTSQTEKIILVKRALELVNKNTEIDTYRGLFLGTIYSQAVESAAQNLTLYALYSVYLLQKQSDDVKIEESRAYKLLIEREVDKRAEFFKNREALFNFVYSNWRWLSLPWKYLLDDINIERSFYNDQIHPLDETYSKLIDAEGEYAQRLKELGYERVIDAIEDGHLEFLPQELQEAIGKALENEPELLSKMVSSVNLFALIFSEEGRSKILSHPRGVELLDKFIPAYNFNKEAPYNWNGARIKPSSSDGIWHQDYRWAMENPKALELFEGMVQSEELFVIRMKSLSLGVPYSGPNSREKTSLLRLLALAKNLPYETAERSRLRAAFGLVGVETDKDLGVVNDLDRAQVVNGIFAANRSWKKDHNKPEDSQEFYAENDFYTTEEELMLEALRVEAYERGLISREYKGGNPITKRAIKGLPLPQMTLRELLNSASQLNPDELENSFRFYLIKDSSLSQNEFSFGRSMVIWDGGFTRGASTQMKTYNNPDVSLWWEHFERIVFNPNAYSLSVNEQVEMVKTLGLMGKTLSGSSVRINQEWLDSKEWLLSPLVNSDIPFAVEGLVNKDLRAVFKNARVFMVLPFYYAVKYTGKAINFEGIGKHRNSLLIQWAEVFERKYADELNKMNMDQYLNLPDDLLQYIHQVYINNVANHNGVVAREFKKHVKDLDEFDQSLKERGDAFITGARIDLDIIKMTGLDIEWFKKEISKQTFKYFFDKSRFSRYLTPWDNLVSHLLGTELVTVSDRIQSQRGSLQTYTLSREAATPVEVVESADIETVAPPGSCKAALGF